MYLGFWGFLGVCFFFVVNDARLLHILAEGFSNMKLSGCSSDLHITLAFHVVPSGIFTT